ncbi:unnamed protein product, partial [Brassica rapa subsp. trilocularis]
MTMRIQITSLWRRSKILRSATACLSVFEDQVRPTSPKKNRKGGSGRLLNGFLTLKK